MTWSEWIQDPPYNVESVLTLEFEDLVGGLGSSVGIIDSINRADAQVTWDTQMGSTMFAYRTGVLCTPSPSWSTCRDWWPLALDPLTEGVDFTVIPGKDPYVDDDAYVEYDTTPNVIAGWNLYGITTEWINPYAGPLAVPGSSLTVELHYGLPALSPGDAPAFPSAGSGAVLATYTGSYASEVLYPPDPGPVTSVGLFVYDPNYSASPPLGPDIYDALGSAGWGIGNQRPWVQVTLPRYRYWKLGPNLNGKLLDDRVRFWGS